MKLYTVRSNDTIFRISVFFFYRHDLWPLIYFFNEKEIGKEPLILQTNSRLKIPDVITYERYHTAVAGDNSVRLAEKYYGVKYYYRIIDEANGYPPVLKEGIEYKIPPLCEELYIKAADDLRREIGLITDI